jgi:hypothetical protein
MVLVGVVNLAPQRLPHRTEGRRTTTLTALLFSVQLARYRFNRTTARGRHSRNLFAVALRQP